MEAEDSLGEADQSLCSRASGLWGPVFPEHFCLEWEPFSFFKSLLQALRRCKWLVLSLGGEGISFHAGRGRGGGPRRAIGWPPIPGGTAPVAPGHGQAPRGEQAACRRPPIPGGPFICLLCSAAVRLVPNGQTGVQPARELEGQPPCPRPGSPRTAAPFRRQ